MGKKLLNNQSVSMKSGRQASWASCSLTIYFG